MDMPTAGPHASGTRPAVAGAEGRSRDHWDDPVRGRLSWTLLVDGADTAPDAVTTGVAELGAEGWLGLHRHRAGELYHVLEGDVVVTIDGREHELAPGATAYLPGDVEHGVRAAGTGPARLLFVFPDSTYDEVRYRFSAEDGEGGAP